MPFPDHHSISTSNNLLINEELAYDNEILHNEFKTLHGPLTAEHASIFKDTMTAVDNNNGGVFFVYGYGGTGKTFLWNTLSAAIRCEGKIVLNVASSGIASLLLPGGRTTHSRFHIPLNVNEDSMCHMKPISDVAHLLKETSLIIWDEATMIHKHAFEALDKSLKDILCGENASDCETPFGGKVIVFGGDFRQILHVVPGGSSQDIVSASLCSSYLWSKCKVFKLTKNMRLTQGDQSSEIEYIRSFAKWLLDLGEGNVGGENDGEAIIEIPTDLLITNSSDLVSELIDFVYPAVLQNFKDPIYWKERAILAPTNEVVHEVNDRLLSIFPGDEKEYLSSDSICQSDYLHDNFDANLYSPKILNGLQPSGLPNHRLVLKVGVLVMLLRNIDVKNGLCNRTRLQIISLGNRVIEAEIISGNNIRIRTFFPRLTLTPFLLNFKEDNFHLLYVLE